MSARLGIPALCLLSACLLLSSALVTAGRDAQPVAFQPYLGQAAPGPTPTLFAPGVVSTALPERDIAIAPDGREIYWRVATPGQQAATIVVSAWGKRRWSAPAVAHFATDARFGHIEPAIAPDGARFYFTRTENDAAGRIAKARIMVMDRGASGWSAPRDLGAPVNGDWNSFFPSVTQDGTLYFTREARDGSDGAIYRARRAGAGFATPERLPSQANPGAARFNAFIDPAERYLIVAVEGRRDTVGGIDYYAVFRNADDTWTEAVNLGTQVNTAGSGEYSAFVSRDGRYFFFMSSRAAAVPPKLTYTFFTDELVRPGNGSSDVYWMDASFINRLRPQIPR